jgi:NADH-quinone oxidoreductase subunit M
VVTALFGLEDPLTLLTLLPICAAGLLMLIQWATPEESRKAMGGYVRTLAFGIAVLLLCIVTLMAVESISGIIWTDISLGRMEYDNCGTPTTGECALISAIGVNWHLGIDALSFPLVWLTALIVPLSMLVDWNSKRPGYFHPLLLLMQGALTGVFVSMDLFVFYIFWELTLIPMFFLILVWGGEDRRYAAQKFFIFTFSASVLMLAGILIMYLFTSAPAWPGNLTGHTFDLTVMTASAQARLAGGSWAFLGSAGLQKFVFILLLVGFVAKLPSVPLHTWLPDAHVQAPTAGSMILAGVMLKMGAYGFLRISATLLPEALIEFRWLLFLLGMVSLVYGAWVCLGQSNLKRMVAYSSISHMGLVLLGIATLQPLGIAGAIFMMFAHGIISPLLFAVAGSFKRHYHTLEIGSMRGIAKVAPWLSGYMMFGWMASLGLPLLAGFVAEITILIAFWQSFGWWVLLPALTLIITAAYYVWSMQRTIFEGGDEVQLPESMGAEKPVDISWHEHAGMAMLAVLIFIFGILPFIFFDMISGYSTTLTENALIVAMNNLGVQP